MRAVALGPSGALKVGGETVLHRHEKTFVNQTALAVNISDTDDPAQVDRVLTGVRDYVLDRVGERLTLGHDGRNPGGERSRGVCCLGT